MSDYFNERTFPIIALAAVIFVMIMSITYGAAILTDVSFDKGNTTESEATTLRAYDYLNVWVITIALIILAMIIIIGLTIAYRSSHGIT